MLKKGKDREGMFKGKDKVNKVESIIGSFPEEGSEQLKLEEEMFEMEQQLGVSHKDRFFYQKYIKDNKDGIAL